MTPEGPVSEPQTTMTHTMTMSPVHASANERWASGFAERPDLLTGEPRLVGFRRAAIARLAETPFPTRRDEDWRYADFTRVLTQAWSTARARAPRFERADFEIADFDGYVLVTVDGAYDASRSDVIPGVTVATADELFDREPYAFWLDRTLAELHSPTSNAFVALNGAFAHDSLLISVPRGFRLERPVHVIHVATRASTPRMICGQVLVMLAGGAELTIDETFHVVGEGQPVFRNHLVRGGISSQARLKFRSIQDEDTRDYHLSNASFDQQAASYLDHVRVDLGGAQVRNNLDIIHKAAGLESYMAGAYFARGTQRIDNQTFIDHAYPNGESNELYKGIVMERGVTSFNGKVIVRPDAQKTNAFQQNDNLVIGDRAEANAKPQLEIFADDVKCSHGATIGQMDEAPVFYLNARGIPRAQAIAMLQRGFLLEVLERVDSVALRAHVEELLQRKFAA